MYTIVPANLWETKFDVFYSGQHSATLSLKALSMKDEAHVTINTKSYRIHRQGVFRGDWYMESDTGICATASKPYFFRDQFIITFDSHKLLLKSKFMSLKNRFSIYKGTEIIGTIAQSGFVSTTLECTISDDIPQEVVLFVVYLALVVIARKRASSNTAT